MRFNLRWLLDYLETDLKYQAILDAVTMAGLEVEEAIDLGFSDGTIVFGEILEVNPHPNADKLSFCKVSAGGAEPLDIVCGAKNIAPGQRIPLATVGATLPGGFKLKATKIRGIESQGMMCSARELGVGDDHEGIWIMPPDSPVGEPFDALVDIKVTPNRPDALSLIGVARDLAAKTGGKLRTPEVKFTEAAERAESVAKITIEAREDCPRYAARVIKGVTIGESPIWMQRRLEAAGLRPINNVVDVTNYVMLEMGHPLHAFDLSKIAQRTIVVRNARPGEKMTLLDETEAELLPSDLLICDTEKPVALAGIMGGGNSEISPTTTDILLEAAYFKPATIRRTAKRLALSTDASYRFERGTDPKRLINALHRAAQLIKELAGGEILKGHLDVITKLPEHEPITLRIDRLRRLSGLTLTGREITTILGSLGFEVQRADENELVVAIPSFRPDIAGEADLIEEATRIHGYDRIPASLPSIPCAPDTLQGLAAISARIVDELTSMGINQAINFSFVSPAANELAGVATDDPRVVRVLNPLSADQSVMRRSLIPSLIQNVVLNLNQSAESIRLFEIGRTYAWKSDAPTEDEDPRSMEPSADERPWLAVALCGQRPGDWKTPAREMDFYDLKGIAETLLDRLGLGRIVIESAKDIGHLHPGKAAAFLKGGERVCWFGELHPALAKELDIKKRVFLLECPLDGPILGKAELPKLRELPRTPSVKRDLALLVDAKLPALDVERTIKSAGGALLVSIRLFDVYEGKNVEEGKKSLAFSLTFRDPDPDKTLTDQRVQEAIDKIIKGLEKNCGAKLRA
ncbi:MAG: phenylalanyl-tRNA synthetase beta chain [Candidatus Sumerlaeota bacterium]|nr:phenylalanyl-tRNA synthetase beta chain [Candidatus Sumerlaeota bacterium]